MKFLIRNNGIIMLTPEILNDVHNHNADIQKREIYLHSHLSHTDDNDPGVEYKMASTFYKNIRLLDTISNEPILVHMHSRGGNWNDGMTIYDSILMCKSHVTVIVYGQAESMSSIILQAADKRVMMPNAYFMCHFGATGLNGNYLDVQQAAFFEKETVDKMLDIYTNVCISGKYFKERQNNQPDYDKVKNFLKRKFKDGDWYLNANQAVYYGFADMVLNNRKHKTIDSLK